MALSRTVTLDAFPMPDALSTIATWLRQCPIASIQPRHFIAQLVLDAHGSGVGPNVGAFNIVYVVIRFSRPLSIGLEPSSERTIAHHQPDHYLNGLDNRER